MAAIAMAVDVHRAMPPAKLPVVLTNHASRQVNKQKKAKWRAWLAIRMNFKQNRVKKGQNRDKMDKMSQNREKLWGPGLHRELSVLAR